MAEVIKCPKCSRPYSAKLASCPFCAQDEMKPQPGSPFRPEPPMTSPGGAPLPSAVDARADAEAAERGVWMKTGALAAVVFLTALWSFMSEVGGTRLGDESTGLFGPCLFAGVVLAAGTGFLFHRWSDGQAIPLTGIVTAVMILPWAGASYGMAKWFNAAGIDDREQPIDCILTSKGLKHSRRGGDLGWEYTYKCTVEGDVEIHGRAHDYAATPAVNAEPGQPIRMTVARGRFGIWLRRSDPITPPRS